MRIYKKTFRLFQFILHSLKKTVFFANEMYLF